MVDPTPHLRRSDRRLVGGAPSARPDVRVACVDWAPVVRLVDHVTNAIADNASTRVVTNRVPGDIFGIFATRDLELTPVDQNAREQNRERLLKYVASQMAHGPAALSAALQKLEQVRRMALDDLQRKRQEVRQASDADIARLETWQKNLERVELVCDIVTIWSPAGRVGKIVKGITTAKDTIETGREFAQIWRTVNDLGGITAVLSDERHREVVKQALGDFVHDWAQGELAEKLAGKAAAGVSGFVGNRLPLMNPFRSDNAGKLNFSQLVITTWVTEKGIESAGKLADERWGESAYGYIKAATEGWYLNKAQEQKSGAR